MEDELIQFNVNDDIESANGNNQPSGKKIESFSYEQFKKLCGVEKLHWTILPTGTKMAEPKLVINKVRETVTVYRSEKVDTEQPIRVTMYRDGKPGNQFYYALCANVVGEEDF